MHLSYRHTTLLIPGVVPEAEDERPVLELSVCLNHETVFTTPDTGEPDAGLTEDRTSSVPDPIEG